MKKLVKSKLARRIMKGKRRGQAPQPSGPEDLARAIFAVADKGLKMKKATKEKTNPSSS